MCKFHSGFVVGQEVPIHTGSSNVAFAGKGMQLCAGISISDSFVNKLNSKHVQEHQQSLVTEMSTERLFVSIHVDDILLVCKPGDVEWFQSTVSATLTMKVDGPHMPGDGSQVMYLKKRMTKKPGGILVQPNATYNPKLVGLMEVSGRRKKSSIPCNFGSVQCRLDCGK